MANIKIEIAENGTTTLATAGKYCDRNIDVEVNVAGGGGGEGISEEVLNITGNCQYRFAYNGWNKFVEHYGKQINTSNITQLDNMFLKSTELIEIPFEINASNSIKGIDAKAAFQDCEKLEVLPMINNFSPGISNSLFYGCSNLRNFPNGFGDNWDYDYIQSNRISLSYLYNDCRSLRKIPTVLLNNFWCLGTTGSSNYYRTFTNCYALDEINGLGVNTAILISNVFNQTFNCCYRLNDMTFQTNEDGTPKTAQWRNQTIILSSVGNTLAGQGNYILNYNSGITADKEVKDDATYQALKNDADWYSLDVNYSRYNHTSAVRTINSLPDCSAYLASLTSTYTNTITFKGAAGALTDGGAINTLTEEEIAVAAAKGWTVSLV